jgi:hypothetical protein
MTKLMAPIVRPRAVIGATMYERSPSARANLSCSSSTQARTSGSSGISRVHTDRPVRT